MVNLLLSFDPIPSFLGVTFERPLKLVSMSQGLTLYLFHTFTFSFFHDPMICTDGFVPFTCGKRGCSVLANCSLCDVEATLSYLAGQSVVPKSSSSLLVSVAPANMPFSSILSDPHSVHAKVSSYLSHTL